MSADARTVAVYDIRAAGYADRFRAETPGQALAAFMAATAPGGRVLDLGCGPGNASAFLRAAGFEVDPVDASAGMVQVANERHGLCARQATFDDLDAVAVYDGVWANFSLLHAPRDALPRHLAAIRRALKPRGVLHLGMKTGTGEGRDGLDRFYTYYSRADLLAALARAGFVATSVREGRERGLAGTEDPFVVILAHA